MEEEMMISDELRKDLWKVPVEIEMIRDKNISNGAFRLYTNLLAYARANTTCFPSRATLAEDLGVKPITIDRNKAELKEKALLDWVKYIGKDGREHNKYTLLKYKPIQKRSVTGNKNVPHTGTKMIHVQVHECFSNNTNNKNTKDNNSSTTKAESKAELLAPVSRQQHLTTLYNKYIPGIKLRKSDVEVLAKLDKVEEYIPYLPYFDEKYWNTTTKHPSVLPHIYTQLQTFVRNFTNTSAFHILCKELKKQGVDIDSIIDQADTPAKGKQEIVRRYL